MQASEKLWGAAAELVKAVAANKDITLGTYRSLWNFIYKLSTEKPEMNLLQDFRVAESLRINFYEDHLPPEIVKISAEQVKKLINNLGTFL